jgi:glutathione synthase/RimK-type ligase-like ATP-grasp enzyme
MKPRLVTKKLASRSLKRLAVSLTNKLQYKVWRSKFTKPKRLNLLYGDCKDKITQYEYFKAQGIPALDFTTNYQEALEWVKDGVCVVARTLTRASEGKGIVVAETPEQLPKAPVYTVYKKKKKEFRVHVFNDKVICVLEKRKKKGLPEVNSKIRNTVNGYVFCRDGVIEPEGIRELAIKASKVTTSSFKGVDIGYNEKLNHLFVIEVNSAPGMENTTVEQYANAILGECV